MDTFAFKFVAAIFVLLSIWLSKRKRGKNPLPGPTGLPIVGYIPFMTRKPYVKLQQLSKTYGPVYKVRLGSRDVVMLCDFKSIKDAFNSDAFMGRPPDLSFGLSETTIRSGAFLDISWKEQKRFVVHMIKDLGFGKTRIEDHIKEEILELLELVENQSGSPIIPTDFLAPSMSNNIASFIFGKRLKGDDPKRKRLNKLLDEVSHLARSVIFQIFFPWLAAVLNFFSVGNKKRFSKAINELKAYVKEEIKEHEATLDSSNIRDFMDGYLLEIQKRSDDVTSTFHKDTLNDIARGFFGAGSETVRITVDWMLLVYAAFTDVQANVHQEIDKVLGWSRFPTWQDSLDMPYTEATIHELMRWKSIVPLNVMRYTLKDTELNGYFVPKHSFVLAVLYAVDHDKSLWGKDTETYKPERFLDENRETVVKPEHFIPFSIGKRSCPSKALAEIEVFLYVTAILQRFKVSLPPGKKADFEGELGIGFQPKKQQIIFELR